MISASDKDEEWFVGQWIRVTAGPFERCIGRISEIDWASQHVKVKVIDLGREIPVELDFSEIIAE